MSKLRPWCRAADQDTFKCKQTGTLQNNRSATKALLGTQNSDGERKELLPSLSPRDWCHHKQDPVSPLAPTNQRNTAV